MNRYCRMVLLLMVGGCGTSAVGADDEMPPASPDPNATFGVEAGTPGTDAPAATSPAKDAGTGSNPGATSGDAMQLPAAEDAARFDVVSGANGRWEEITPPGFDYQNEPNNFGVLTIAGGMADQPNTFYLAGGKYDSVGIWKTTDNATTWAQVSGSGIDGSNGWLTVDFSNSNILYINQLYGSGFIMKSVDGGKTWRNVTKGSQVTNNDIGFIKMDPTDHLHLVAGPHSGADAIYETFDGGDHWDVHTSTPPGGCLVFFLAQDDGGHPSGWDWVCESKTSGLWRSATGGRVGGTAVQGHRDGTPGIAAWKNVSMGRNLTHGATAFARLANKAILMSVDVTVMRSIDNGWTWIDLAAGAGQGGDLPTSGDALSGLCNDGVHVWTMMSNTGCGTAGKYPIDFPSAGTKCGTLGYRWLVTATTGDGSHWTEYNTQSFQDGPHGMLYDPNHGIVYSANWNTGLFRLKLR